MADLWIAPELLEDIIAHCQREWPEEACGLLALDGDRVVAAWRGTNVLHSPVRYRMADEEVARVMWEIEVVRGQVAASYHAHPQGPPAPSPTDLAEAACRANLIVSLAERARPLVRAFRIERGRATGLCLRVGPPASARGTSTRGAPR
jgi:proteasome lid subunit RPN8/RPN11